MIVLVLLMIMTIIDHQALPRVLTVEEADPLLLSVRAAARRLGIGRDTTYALIRERRLRSLSVGRRILVPVAELERFVEREAERESA